LEDVGAGRRIILKCIKNLVVNLKEGSHLEDVGAGIRIILKCIKNLVVKPKGRKPLGGYRCR
jgi:hypothetical protein